MLEEVSPTEAEEIIREPLKVSRLHTRSLSDHFLSSKTTENLIGDPIPTSLKLQTIFSGKEVEEKLSEKFEEIARKGRMTEGGRRKGVAGAGGSKSLSELEFMELKGFMDLGFVFSEEEFRNSNLVSMIPGLQRLGRRKEEEEEEEEEEEKGSVVSRPYLSEAWEAIDEGMKKSLLMNWRVPVLGTTEIAMKDHLKVWAQTVASTVR